MGIAFLLTVVGIALYINFLDFPREPRLEQISLFSATDVQARLPGHPVLIEGHISRDNLPQYQRLVAYKVERQHRSGSFNIQQQVRPMLLLELADGSVSVGGNYQLLRPPETQIYHPEVPEENNTYRIRGFVADSPALVFGTTRADAAGSINIEARLLYGGTHAEFIAEQQHARFWGDWLGLTLAGCGLLLFSLLFVVSIIAGVFRSLSQIADRLHRRLRE